MNKKHVLFGLLAVTLVLGLVISCGDISSAEDLVGTKWQLEYTSAEAAAELTKEGLPTTAAELEAAGFPKSAVVSRLEFYAGGKYAVFEIDPKDNTEDKYEGTYTFADGVITFDGEATATVKGKTLTFTEGDITVEYKKI